MVTRLATLATGRAITSTLRDPCSSALILSVGVVRRQPDVTPTGGLRAALLGASGLGRGTSIPKAGGARCASVTGATTGPLGTFKARTAGALVSSPPVVAPPAAARSFGATAGRTGGGLGRRAPKGLDAFRKARATGTGEDATVPVASTTPLRHPRRIRIWL